MCVERFITHSGRIPPAFRITFRTLVSCFPGLSLSCSLLGSWLLSKPYSPSSSTLSPCLLMHTLLSTFNAHPQSPPPRLLQCHPPGLCTPPCPACTPSPFAKEGTVSQPVPSTILCKPSRPDYAPSPFTHPLLRLRTGDTMG